MARRKKKIRTKDAQITLRLSSTLRKALEEKARAREIDLTTYCRMLLKLGVDKEKKER
ncbi:MAG: hypothetical protein JSV08_04610 [Acidobacteriota bacterium]|nr:MAG: hypothetical protein JSV08_04610 [Acidobacteriota bacterium]